MSSYRIIIADDHSIFREGLKALISHDPQLKLVGEAKDGQELLSLLKSTWCDLVIADISMPQIDGLIAVKKIKIDHPKVKILILSMHKDYQHFKLSVFHGASGFLAKDDISDELLVAIHTILKGKRYVSPSVTTALADREIRSLDNEESPSLEILTKREQQILELIARGMANKAIAAKLKISVRTVQNHRLNLTDKLGLKSTADLVKYAISKGLI